MRQILIHFTFLFVISACSSQDKNIDFSEYDILTTANELVQYYDISLDTSGLFEMARIRKYIDGAYELKYEYDLMESETFLPLFYSIKIEKDVSEDDAKETFAMGKSVILKTNSAIGNNVEEIKGIVSEGNESYYALRKNEEETTGLLLLIRKEKINYTMIMSGLYTSDHSLITDLVLPKLANLENFQIEIYE